RLLTPAVAQHQRQPGHQERRLAQPDVDLVDRDLRLRQEDLPVGPPADPGAGGLLRRLTAVAHTGLLTELRGRPLAVEVPGDAAAETDLVDAAVPVDLDVQPGGQGVDDRGADAVQATGGRVRSAAELAAGVQLRVDELDSGEPR